LSALNAAPALGVTTNSLSFVAVPLLLGRFLVKFGKLLTVLALASEGTTQLLLYRFQLLRAQHDRKLGSLQHDIMCIKSRIYEMTQVAAELN